MKLHYLSRYIFSRICSFSVVQTPSQGPISQYRDGYPQEDLMETPLEEGLREHGGVDSPRTSAC